MKNEDIKLLGELRKLNEDLFRGYLSLLIMREQKEKI